MAEGLYEALDAVEGVQGWLSPAQAALLHDRASAIDAPARVVEIGSYQGRSTIVLARGIAEGGEVVAIDPHAGNDRGPRQWEGPAQAGQSDHDRFNANLEGAGVTARVRHVRRFSSEALGDVEGELDLLYVDGAHSYGPALEDIRAWGRRVRPGGEMLIHDSFSSVGVTLALVRSQFASSGWRYLGRAGSLTRYRRETLGPADRLRNLGSQTAELPWFARNLVIKVAVVLRLRPLARLMGQRELEWPY